MTNYTKSNLVCAAAAVLATTLTFAEVTSVQSVDFEYDTEAQATLEA